MTTAALTAEAGEGPEFQKEVERGFGKIYVPVDCDKLGPDGQITPEFVRGMAFAPGHMERVERGLPVDASDKEKIDAFALHLAGHISMETDTGQRLEQTRKVIEDSAEVCRTHFPNNSF